MAKYLIAIAKFGWKKKGFSFGNKCNSERKVNSDLVNVNAFADKIAKSKKKRKQLKEYFTKSKV